MKKHADKRWRLESINTDPALWGLPEDDPRTAWKRLWAFDDDQYTKYEGLVEELNRINAPVIIRIVRTSG